MSINTTERSSEFYKNRCKVNDKFVILYDEPFMKVMPVPSLMTSKTLSQAVARGDWLVVNMNTGELTVYSAARQKADLQNQVGAGDSYEVAYRKSKAAAFQAAIESLTMKIKYKDRSVAYGLGNQVDKAIGLIQNHITARTLVGAVFTVSGIKSIPARSIEYTTEESPKMFLSRCRSLYLVMVASTQNALANNN